MAKPKNFQGKIHLYAGDGKGKTTASVGLTVRAAGRDFRVRFVQFLKSGNSAELKILRSLPTVTVVSGQKVNKFTFQMTDEEKQITKDVNHGYWTDAVEAVNNGEVDFLVLDEALGSIHTGLLNEDEVIEFLKNKPADVEVVLTGRDPSDKMIEVADYYSEICARKHPYETEELPARAGIEF